MISIAITELMFAITHKIRVIFAACFYCGVQSTQWFATMSNSSTLIWHDVVGPPSVPANAGNEIAVWIDCRHAAVDAATETLEIFSG